jgi:hypothetical protein
MASALDQPPAGWAQPRHKHIRMTSDSVVAQKRQSKRRLVQIEGLLPEADFEVLRERRLAARRPLFAGLRCLPAVEPVNSNACAGKQSGRHTFRRRHFRIADLGVIENGNLDRKVASFGCFCPFV